ncbi:MAG: DUF1080 domain-containing protein [Planctomycetia bacterium]|nr:DUF1080 domain-containing protein [Planctomycetia bacterium]
MRKKRFTTIFFIGLIIFGLQEIFAADTETGFVSLFNGKDLTGWTVKGGSGTFKVEDGVIVGECVPNTPHNTFLCTEKEYGDFILKLEFKMDVSGNSGVQFRSHVRKKNNRERVFGYQAEIDHEEDGDTGKIYDEGRRGSQHGIRFLGQNSPEIMKKVNETLKQGQWNTLEIQCVGPSIRTWVNGVAAANIFDYYDLSGILGLQVHAGKQGKICFRNIRIKDLGKTEWKSFFVKDENGKMKLVNAHFVLPEEWSFDEKEGFLRGRHNRTQAKDGLVVSDDPYSDFIVKVTYRIFGGNSALYFRAEEVNTPWLLKGFQNEIAGNEKDSALWHTAGDKTPGRGWVAQNDALVKKVRQTDDWNTVCTTACGDRIINMINGFTTFDIIDPKCEKTGKVALQLHGNADVEMWFKDFQIIVITEEMKKWIHRD